MDKKKINFKEFFAKVKVEYLIVFALAVVALFIFLSSVNSEKTESMPIDAYVSGLEKSLEKSLSNVRGAGRVEVIISVKSGMQTVLATKTENIDGKITETPVLVNGKTVVLKEDYPEVSGVVVVCEGANNLTVKMSVINAVCVYLGIDESKVEILVRK